MQISAKRKRKKKSCKVKLASFSQIYLSAVRKYETFPILVEMLTHTFRIGIHKPDIILSSWKYNRSNR